MGVPMDAFRLLVAEDEHEAEGLAEYLDHINNERKGVVASLVKEVKRKIKERYGEQSKEQSMPSTAIGGGKSKDEDNKNDQVSIINDQVSASVISAKAEIQGQTSDSISNTLDSRLHGNDKIPSVLVLGNPQWKPSLLGLAANTCVEEFGRPVFLWGRNGDGLYKGSCRTVDGDGVHLVELMTAVAPNMFTQFGGHVGAGGFTVNKEAIFNLEEILNKAYEKIKNDQGLRINNQEGKKDFVDGIIKTDDITWNLYDEINKFAPFGTGNPKPVFMIQDATIAAVKHFGKEKNHLELILEKDSPSGVGGTVSAIAFFKKSGDFAAKLEIGAKATIIGTLEKSTFKWKPELRLRILDVQ
jgi:single-stranded-DNA-specific exonuclease